MFFSLHIWKALVVILQHAVAYNYVFLYQGRRWTFFLYFYYRTDYRKERYMFKL